MNFWLDDKRRTAKRSDKETASDREEAGKDRRLVTSPLHFPANYLLGFLAAPLLALYLHQSSKGPAVIESSR
jgi:hypothetical protein